MSLYNITTSPSLCTGQGVIEALSVLGKQNWIAIRRLIQGISDHDIAAVRKAGYLHISCGNQTAIDELGKCVWCGVVSKY